MTETINKVMIEELKELMEEDFPLLINTFLEDSSKRLVALELAIAEDNANEVRESAHGIKGSSSNLGAAKLAEISSNLETMGRTGDLSEAVAMFSEMNNEYKIVLEYFTSLLE
jgi:HPt (histidine-containing phosphotransfer) domain-containing protein